MNTVGSLGSAVELMVLAAHLLSTPDMSLAPLVLFVPRNTDVNGRLNDDFGVPVRQLWELPFYLAAWASKPFLEYEVKILTIHAVSWKEWVSKYECLTWSQHFGLILRRSSVCYELSEHDLDVPVLEITPTIITFRLPLNCQTQIKLHQISYKIQLHIQLNLVWTRVAATGVECRCPCVKEINHGNRIAFIAALIASNIDRNRSFVYVFHQIGKWINICTFFSHKRAFNQIWVRNWRERVV